MQNLDLGLCVCTRVCVYVGHESRKEVNNRKKGCNGGKQKMIECMWHEDKGRDYLWETRGQQKEVGVSTI